MSKSLLTAFGVCTGAAAVLFLLLYILTGEVSAAQSIAPIPLLGIPYLYEQIEKGNIRLWQPIENTEVYSFDRFLIGWKTMIVVGFAVMYSTTFSTVFVVFSLFNLAIGQPIAYAPGAIALLVPLASMAATVAAMFLSYFVAKWIGTRSRSHGILITILVGSSCVIVGHASDYIFLSDDMYLRTHGGVEKSFSHLLKSILFWLPISQPALIVGCLHGQHTRRIAFVRHLYWMLPKPSREAFVDLLADEATRHLRSGAK